MSFIVYERAIERKSNGGKRGRDREKVKEGVREIKRERERGNMERGNMERARSVVVFFHCFWFLTHLF